MLPTTIRSPPAEGDYTPLAEYQSQTPSSFTNGKPILHLHVSDAKASIPRSQCGSLAIFPSDAASQDANDVPNDAPVEETVDVYVTSESFIVFSRRLASGVSIPYPSISIHAIKSTDQVWMQLDFADGGADDDDFQTVELTVSVATSATPLYEAISSCSNLHPDPTTEDDDDDGDRIVFDHEAVEGFAGVLRGSTDGGLPPPMPGSGGWITADNVHDFFDADGNWLEELGEGAGRTRPRDEVEVNGHEDSENKRPRVD